ncbi:MAG: glutamate dehydrogenase [Xanthobacteraceae bacterium]|nr:MAG: glutamate dehydrogenase [Xanthobacteraceae bacterium]
MTNRAEDARGAAAIIEQAGIILRGTEASVPADYVSDLFGRTDPEDLVAYDARDLASLAAQSYAAFARRPAGQSAIRLFDPEPTSAASQLASVTVIEVVNENMPFLVDSVLGVLSEQGLKVRLVVHPILTVEREHDGALSAYRGLEQVDQATSASPTGSRCRSASAPSSRT